MDKRLKRMLFQNIDGNFIRFKYYGDFDRINILFEKCVDDFFYIGNSRLDGSPIFIYSYSNINIINLDKLNKRIRILKIKHYSNKKLTNKEESLLMFFKFFINSYENLEIKGVVDSEIRELLN